jgi:hypothetical protein
VGDFETGKIYRRKGNGGFLFRAIEYPDYETYDSFGDTPGGYLYLEKYRLVSIIEEALDFSEFEEA